MQSEPEMIPYEPVYSPALPPEEAVQNFYEIMKCRRSVREFSTRPVSRALMEGLVKTACTAPSGANKQPWRFVCIQDPEIKQAIRIAAEKEEQAFYTQRANDAWLKDLDRIGTDANKKFLEDAPWLVAVFKLTKADDGSQTYYTSESVGIAVGLFLAAAQQAGLATLTHTPSPMKFLCEVLRRPAHERPFVLIPVGYPAANCKVPLFSTTRKPLSDAMVIDRPE